MIMVDEWWSSVVKENCVGNTYFEHRSFYKYTRVAKGVKMEWR